MKLDKPNPMRELEARIKKHLVLTRSMSHHQFLTASLPDRPCINAYNDIPLIPFTFLTPQSKFAKRYHMHPHLI